MMANQAQQTVMDQIAKLYGLASEYPGVDLVQFTIDVEVQRIRGIHLVINGREYYRSIESAIEMLTSKPPSADEWADACAEWRTRYGFPIPELDKLLHRYATSKEVRS